MYLSSDMIRFFISHGAFDLLGEMLSTVAEHMTGYELESTATDIFTFGKNAGIKEKTAEIEDLNKRIQELESQVKALTAPPPYTGETFGYTKCYIGLRTNFYGETKKISAIKELRDLAKRNPNEKYCGLKYCKDLIEGAPFPEDFPASASMIYDAITPFGFELKVK